MAILLYANGITEEHKPENYTFLDDQLINIFPDFEKIRTYRLAEVSNTWCLWGEHDPVDKVSDEFNKIGSDIIEYPCYSPILFVHDTEIDTNWKLTDSIILNGYEQFKRDLLIFFDEIAADIIEERDQNRKKNGGGGKLIRIDQIAVSEDKRIIFNFDLDKQPKEFFNDSNFGEFANRVLDFLKFSYKDGETFALHADKHIIIIIKDNQVKPFIDRILAFFGKKENYEACSLLRSIFERWNKYKDELERSKNKESKKENDDKKEE